MHRNRLFVLASILTALLCLCSCAGPEGVAVVYATPLPNPIYEEADRAQFSMAYPLDDLVGKFIFKGKIDRVQEINLSLDATGEDSRWDEWHSVCDVTVLNTLYGDAPDKKESVKVLFGQSSRRFDKSGFALVEGQEYYFISYVITEYDRTNMNPIHNYADVIGGVYYDIFPVSDGVVRYQGWKFEGAQVLGKKDPTAKLKHEDLCTIDEDDFLKQFTAMIEAAKTKAEASATGTAGR